MPDKTESTPLRVAVIVASRHGGTRGIAEAIASELGAHGIDAVVRDASDPGHVKDFDAVVLGSAIYAGRWLAPAKALLWELDPAKPNWLFSSGPLGDPPMPAEPAPAEIDEMAERIGARGHAVFAGRLERSALGPVERIVVRALHAPEGDFRDRPEAREWARGIAAALTRTSIGG